MGEIRHEFYNYKWSTRVVGNFKKYAVLQLGPFSSLFSSIALWKMARFIFCSFPWVFWTGCFVWYSSVSPWKWSKRKPNVNFFIRSSFVQSLLTSLADRLYRPYASSVSFELKILAGILNSVQKPKSKRDKDFLLWTDSSSKEDEPVAEKLAPLNRNSSDVTAVILRHLVSFDPSYSLLVFLVIKFLVNLCV